MEIKNFVHSIISAINIIMKYVRGIYAVLLLGFTLNCKTHLSTKDYFEQAHTYRSRWLNDSEKTSKVVIGYRNQSKARGSRQYDLCYSIKTMEVII
jgi:hypothetical protein